MRVPFCPTYCLLALAATLPAVPSRCQEQPVFQAERTGRSPSTVLGKLAREHPDAPLFLSADLFAWQQVEDLQYVTMMVERDIPLALPLPLRTIAM